MKAVLFCLILMVAVPSVAANDTLTRAQVYNFNVGDTFDYKLSGGMTNNSLSYYTNYRRDVIQQVYYSVDSNMLYIVKEKVYPFPSSTDTVALDSLTKHETLTYLDSNCFTHNFVIDINSAFNGRVQNSLISICFEHNKAYKHAEGLGEVYSHFQGGVSPDPNFFNDESLIYYSKGNEQWGHAIFNTQHLVHYTPVPEECAVWTAKIYNDFPPITQNNLAITEQIQSGNKVAYAGHAFIEMIYRSYNHNTGQYTPDSLIGYYRNDTVNRKLLFYKLPTDTSFKQYDFGYACPDPNCLSQVMVGGQLRTRWPGYIEGVGGTMGLLPVKYITYTTPGVYHPYAILNGTLSSFCVCGQVMYTTDSTATCSLISGVPFITTEVNANVFPNPANFQFTIQLHNGFNDKTSFVLFDVFGKQVKQHKITTEQTIIERENLPNGIYYWQLTDEQKITQRGKLILR